MEETKKGRAAVVLDQLRRDRSQRLGRNPVANVVNTIDDPMLTSLDREAFSMGETDNIGEAEASRA